jgi:hypothetical protein
MLFGGSRHDTFLLAGPPTPWCRAPAVAPANLQPFLAIETTEVLVVHDKSLTAHHHKQGAIAEATAKPCKLAQPLPHSLITKSSSIFESLPCCSREIMVEHFAEAFSKEAVALGGNWDRNRNILTYRTQ